MKLIFTLSILSAVFRVSAAQIIEVIDSTELIKYSENLLQLQELEDLVTQLDN